MACDFLHKQSEGYDNNNRTPISISRYDDVLPTIILNLHVGSEDEVIVESQVVDEDYIDSDLLSDFSNNEIKNILEVCGII